MPYSREFGDHFYCRTDGRLECGHVFLAGNGLPERWATGGAFTIGELGFGTGLNFCETWRQWKAAATGGTLHFVSFERFPMQAEEISGRLPIGRRSMQSGWLLLNAGRLRTTAGSRSISATAFG